MPRKARIDAPGALHHIIIRRIEGRRIFSDERDRDNFVDRLGDFAFAPVVSPAAGRSSTIGEPIGEAR